MRATTLGIDGCLRAGPAGAVPGLAQTPERHVRLRAERAGIDHRDPAPDLMGEVDAAVDASCVNTGGEPVWRIVGESDSPVVAADAIEAGDRAEQLVLRDV